MPIQDRHLAWKYGQLWIPAKEFLSVSNIGINEGGATNHAAAATVGSPATDGAPVSGDLGTTATEAYGVLMAAAGDEIATWIPIPTWWDTDHPLQFRVWFTHQATDADAPIWKVHLHPRVNGSEALQPVLANADETITFTAHTVSTTADVVEATSWTSATATTLAGTDTILGISLECDSLGSASANEIVLIGLEIRYTVSAMTDTNAREITV